MLWGGSPKISGKSKNIQPLGEANLRDRDQAASRKSAGRRFMIAVFLLRV